MLKLRGDLERTADHEGRHGGGPAYGVDESSTPGAACISALWRPSPAWPLGNRRAQQRLIAHLRLVYGSGSGLLNADTLGELGRAAFPRFVLGCRLVPSCSCTRRCWARASWASAVARRPCPRGARPLQLLLLHSVPLLRRLLTRERLARPRRRGDVVHAPWL